MFFCINCFHMVDKHIYKFKAIMFPETPKTLTSNMFQNGLIKHVYLSIDLEEINMFIQAF